MRVPIPRRLQQAWWAFRDGYVIAKVREDRPAVEVVDAAIERSTATYFAQQPVGRRALAQDIVACLRGRGFIQ